MDNHDLSTSDQPLTGGVKIHPLNARERAILSLVRLSDAMKVDKIEWTRQLGRTRVSFEWRSKKNAWGRFGGGWNWKLGIQAGGSTVIFSLLVASLSVSRLPRPKKTRLADAP